MFNLSEDEMRKYTFISDLEKVMKCNDFDINKNREEFLDAVEDYIDYSNQLSTASYIQLVQTGKCFIPFVGCDEDVEDLMNEDDAEILEKRRAINDLLAYLSVMKEDTPFLRNLADVVIPYCVSVFEDKNVDDLMKQVSEQSDCDNCECNDYEN